MGSYIDRFWSSGFLHDVEAYSSSFGQGFEIFPLSARVKHEYVTAAVISCDGAVPSPDAEPLYLIAKRGGRCVFRSASCPTVRAERGFCCSTLANQCPLLLDSEYKFCSTRGSCEYFVSETYAEPRWSDLIAGCKTAYLFLLRRCRAFRIARFRSMRRFSPLDIYHLRFRSSPRIPLLATCFRKRRSRSSWDSPGLSCTLIDTFSPPLSAGFLANPRKPTPRHLDNRPEQRKISVVILAEHRGDSNRDGSLY